MTPVLPVPVLWVGVTAAVLASSYYVLHVFQRSHGNNEEESMASTRQKKKIEEVMHEHKRGTLRSGSGKKVRSRKQAVAIAMSESGQSRRKKAG
jgi:hypothetical protein